MMTKYKKEYKRKEKNIEMLTCNKNFVDLTVWILKSWTCILNVMLHQNLEEEQEPGGRATVQAKPRPSPHHRIRPRPNQTGFNWSLLC